MYQHVFFGVCALTGEAGKLHAAVPPEEGIT